jgi:hypothetical protein
MPIRLPSSHRWWLFLLILPFLTYLVKPTQAEMATTVVISEVKVSGNGSNDEFVELYNPTNSPIVLDGWRLRRTSGTEASGSNLIDSITGVIPAHGYFLMAHPDYVGSAVADAVYTATSDFIANNNHVILYSDAGVTEVDRVGLGTAENPENTAIGSNPAAYGSVERKATSTSTLASMIPGGIEALDGNGEDSNNNAADFVIRTTADPQSSSSPLESVGDADYMTVVTLTGSNEVPPVVTGATGAATVEVNLANMRLNYVLSFTGLEGAETMAHIHGMGGTGVNAPPIHTILNGTPRNGYWAYAAEQEDDILAGLTYINVHTTAHSDGEIRGQVTFADVTPTPTDEPTPTPTVEVTPTPTEDPTPTPTEEPTPTPTDEVTPTPTEEVTPTPTMEVTPTPTEEVTPSPTEEVTPTPTDEPTGEPTPTVEPTPTEEPTPTPEPTTKPRYKSFGIHNLTCTRYYHRFFIFGRPIHMPYVVCLPN